MKLRLVATVRTGSFNYQAGLMDIIKDFLSSGIVKKIKELKAQFDSLKLTEEQIETCKKVGFKHLSDKYGISEQELSNIDLPKTADFKQDVKMVFSLVIPVLAALIGLHLMFTAVQESRDALNQLLIVNQYSGDPEWVQHLNHYKSVFWNTLAESMLSLVPGVVFFIYGIRQLKEEL